MSDTAEMMLAGVTEDWVVAVLDLYPSHQSQASPGLHPSVSVKLSTGQSCRRKSIKTCQLLFNRNNRTHPLRSLSWIQLVKNILFLIKYY